ncbi:hypothetical protein COS31_04570 [Candidatus Roizmanbacteria bacterium CG02_land_8_20_14_3_00_36_15]|uniref:Uncharacterized protein n=2 Tax=Candidatus Roizmaniibacteriota TaxID=1752723 RepID=A0A2M8KK77_9BACT|nr:MAG: hypothetical protein COS51_02135 [Candidatus Roizmanbacteria bacterium CG03_land_8_20_14_0_80_36_21]PIV37442.1 MAG: hypothetical protein COS31_04570 [Candidatus Roizmanbacteria bacterium CG02_land_8_20_14_3_00_36_15]PIY70517.1 MAG: hypothetical protein COY89_00620 [Candidatus Roizmanbacteria bacterium CG_4_10_14_0_8_um_filter_36_36]PJA52627.1 MAG: hypothetical protein CO166_04910 [Candidatus Roizmanbacteria bacterium CG_4_9_14_3_um_filter_36_11]PJC81471.1 MAG: hypothetical protein CO007
MDNFNKVISFALGLVVVVVFLAVISGKINLKNKIPQLSGLSKTQVTPSPTTTPRPVQTPSAGYSLYKNASVSVDKTQPTKTIPATGAPTIFIPMLFSTFITGLYFKKRS